MNQKNAILFFGIFSVFVVLFVGGYFVTHLFKGSGSSAAGQNAQFPSNDASSSGTGWLSNFDIFGSTNADQGPQEGIIDGNSPDSTTSSGSDQSQYDYYNGTQTNTPSTPTYPIAPDLKNTTGNPDTGYAPNPADSPYKGALAITDIVSVSADGDDPTTEYVTIQANPENTAKVPLTGMVLKSMVTGITYAIPGAAPLYYQNTVNAQAPTYLNPGDTAYIITGQSPIGSSFHSNKCVGYLQEFQAYTPYLSNNCPLIYYEGLPERPNALSDDCLAYLQNYPACIAPTADIEQIITDTYGRECFLYIQKTANYTYCINTHKNDSDFYEPDWHIYLGKTKHIWQIRREWIRLLDQNGKVVSDMSYIR